jgi:hypothetical protein
MRVGMIDTQAIRKRWDTIGSKLARAQNDSLVVADVLPDRGAMIAFALYQGQWRTVNRVEFTPELKSSLGLGWLDSVIPRKSAIRGLSCATAG